MEGTLSLYSVQQLANDGNENALLTLAIFYTQGRGVPIDYAKSEEFLREAVEKHKSAPAALLLSSILQEQNAYKGNDLIRLHKLAINGGYTEALLNFAIHLLNGQYVEKDKQEALRLLQQGSNQNDINCISFLANLYETGTVVERDNLKAENYYKNAAKLGDIQASEWLLKKGIIPLHISNLYNALKNLSNKQIQLMYVLLRDRIRPFETSFIHLSKYGEIRFWQYLSDSECSWEPQLTAIFLFFLHHDQGVTTDDIRTKWGEEICSIYYIVKHQDEIIENSTEENKTILTFQNVYDLKSWKDDKQITKFYNEITLSDSNRINEIISKINNLLKQSFTNSEVAQQFCIQSIDLKRSKLRFIKAPRKWITCEEGCFPIDFFGKKSYDNSDKFKHLEVNINTSDEVFKTQAENGDRFAQYHWGMHLLKRKESKDKRNGFELVKKSSEQGYEYALRAMGTFYSDGQYVKQNYDTALKYYERSGISFDEMGLIYEYIKKDPDKALQLYKLGQNELHSFNSKLDCIQGHSNILWSKIKELLNIEPNTEKEKKNIKNRERTILKEIVLIDVPLALEGNEECYDRLKTIGYEIDELKPAYTIAKTMTWKQIELAFNLFGEERCHPNNISSLSLERGKLVLVSDTNGHIELNLKKKSMALYLLFLKHQNGLNREAMDNFKQDRLNYLDDVYNPLHTKPLQNHTKNDQLESNKYYKELLLIYSYFKKKNNIYGKIDEDCKKAV